MQIQELQEMLQWHKPPEVASSKFFLVCLTLDPCSHKTKKNPTSPPIVVQILISGNATSPPLFRKKPRRKKEATQERRGIFSVYKL